MQPMQPLTMTPIGTVRSSRTAPVDDHWDAVASSIELDAAQLGPESLAGLDAFSHVEVVYVFDRVDAARVETGARHPRDNAAWPKVGIFAQRGKARPNRIGTTVCRIDRIEGLRVHVTGLDAIDGTPVLDLKPWVTQFGPRGETRQPGWMDELMREYW
jgi:tRNA-Thr(GGU) m(6)t(6)A37 methyltransferase TsaA